MAVGCLAGPAAALDPSPLPYRVLRDIEYARVGDVVLRLDLYMPRDAVNPPLLVWIHGGAWRSGSKEDMPLTGLVEAGYAAASLDYRLSPVARFPAQIHDCKAGIRFLRAHQAHYGFNAERIGIAGSSAGGHLVALLGVTNGHAELEGSLGDHLDVSSDVQAIVDYFGPTDFMTILKQSTPHGLSVREPALDLLIGGRPEAFPELARLASPVFHVDDKDPPLLMLHGDQDPQVPINQSHELQGRYQAFGLDVHLEVVHGGAHGGKVFFDEQHLALVKAFLDKHLRNMAP